MSLEIFGQFFVPACHYLYASVRICNPGSSSPKAAAERGCPRCHESGFPHPFAGREGGEDWGTEGGGQQRIFFSTARQDTRRTCQIRWISHAEVGLTLTVCIIREGSGMRFSHGARSVLGSYWLLLGPSLPPPQHVTTLLPRAPRQGLFADPERCSLGLTWENIPSFVHKDCQCLRACVRARALVCWRERERGGGQTVLSIKMPALCFHTVEQRAGPVEDDTAPERRPGPRARPARINMG